MPNKGAVADFIVSWERLTTNVERNAAELPPHLQLYSAPMVELLNQLRNVGASKEDRRSLKQQETKDSLELQKQGRKLATKLRSALVAHYGPDSELLVAYGMKARRTRKRKPKAETPEPENPESETPAAKPVTQTGGASKPAEQPKPEDPAPASQSNPAPQTS